MIEQFSNLNPTIQALLASFFTWGLTAFGASTVFLTRVIGRKFLDTALGFTAGVMVAASLWSLLAPSVELSAQMNLITWMPPLIGFLLGAISIRGVDMFIPHLHLFKPIEEAEGPRSSWEGTVLLVVAVTIHNIPEGLAVGVAFGAAALGYEGATLGAAVALAIGIGLQNFPEGAAVSIPLRREGLSRLKSFWYGQLSAVVEPIAAVAGAVAVLSIRSILPYAMAFAAGAMIFVVIEEVIPEAQSGSNTDLATLGVIVGFAVMMTLDVALG
jgi:ZIP family zinc transporter